MTTFANPRAVTSIGILSAVEALLGIIAASAVALRPLIHFISKQTTRLPANADEKDSSSYIDDRRYSTAAQNSEAKRKTSQLKLRKDVEGGPVTSIEAGSPRSGESFSESLGEV